MDKEGNQGAAIEQEQDEPSLIARRKSKIHDSNYINEVVSESNGHTDGEGQDPDGVLELMLNGSQDEQEIVDPDGLLVIWSEAINGGQKSGSPVSHDRARGIWKCRICTWTYRNGSVCVDHILNNKGHNNMKIGQNLNFESEGNGLADTHTGEKQEPKDPGNDYLEISSFDFITENSCAMKSTCNEDLESEFCSSSHILPSQISFEDSYSSKDIENPEVDQINGDDLEVTGIDVERVLQKQTNAHLDGECFFNSQISLEDPYSSKEIENAEFNQINGDELEETELDVERVLQKQTTHDLYCPNCNSCITKRVILRKRKRKVRISDEDIKQNKKEVTTVSQLVTGLVQSSGNEVEHANVVGDDDIRLNRTEDENETGPDVFRCLSCFSLFIPIGNGFKILFGQKNGKQVVSDEQAPSVKKNMFTSMFASKKQETQVQQGSSSRTDTRTSSDVGVMPSSNLDDQIKQPSILQNPLSPIHGSEQTVVKIEKLDTLDSKDEILSSLKERPSINGESTVSARGGLDMTAMEAFVPKDQFKESIAGKELDISRKSNLTVTAVTTRNKVTNAETTRDRLSTDKEAAKPSPTPVSVFKLSDMNGKLNISVPIPHEAQHTEAAIPIESVPENNVANSQDSKSGDMYSSQFIIDKPKFEVPSGELLKIDNISYSPAAKDRDAVITIDAQPSGLSGIVKDLVHTVETASVSQPASQISTPGTERTGDTEDFEIEVIKSVIYGGLAESITSLGVVTSAAGGGAATLNTLALGMANIFGGLFIICHNLWKLRDDCVEQAANQISDGTGRHRDRYKELLGRRENFVVHAAVVIISYLLFGLVPPVVYGFSFRESDDKQLKLVAVTAVSLICIAVLAIGRAYIRRPPKLYLKTFVTFVVLGIMVSGVSYVAGNALVADTMPAGAAWAAY